MKEKIWNAELYSENSQLQYEASKLFINELVLQGSESVLDIGCGTGKLTYEVAKKISNGTVVGIDSSESMINYANSHYSLPNLKFIHMNAENMKFEKTFDVIISTFCIHWVKDKAALFNSIVGILSKNGKIKIIVPFRHEGIAQIRSNLMKGEKWSGYFSKIDVDELLVFDNDYEGYTRNAGIDEVVYQTEKKVTVFESREKFKSFLMNITSHLECLPTQKLKDDFIDDILDQYFKLSSENSDEKFKITYVYGKITGKGVKENCCR